MESPRPPLTPMQQQPLAQRIQHLARSGWRVEAQTETSATLVKGHRPNHLLHLILTIITFGLWGIVWIILAFTSKEKRMVLGANQPPTHQRPPA